jgi:hypothetical protein
MSELDRLQRAFLNADKRAQAGDAQAAEDAKLFAAEIRRLQAPTKGLGTRIWENIVGDSDPTTQNFGEKLGTALNMGGEAMTMGLIGDEVGGALDPARLITGETAGERRDFYRGQQASLEATNPGVALTAQIGGGMMAPIAAATTLPSAMAIGAAAGGTYAFMEGEGGARNRLQDGAAGLVFGGLAGAASIPASKVVQWAGRKGGQALRSVFSNQQLFKAGQLTPEGQETLRALGYNVDELSDDFRTAFAKNYSDLADPQQAAAAADLSEFGIPVYRHNVTGSVDDFAAFERARRGAVGPDLEAKIRAAGDSQDTAMRDAADDIARGFSGGIEADQGDAARAVMTGLRSARDAAVGAARGAYDELDNMGAGLRGTQVHGIGSTIRQNLKSAGVALDPRATPNAVTALRELDTAFAKAGRGSVPFMDLERQRQNLNRIASFANRGTTAADSRAMEFVIDAFDERVDELMTSALIDGDTAVLKQAEKARSLWKSYSQRFKGRDGTSKFIQSLISEDASPDDAVRWLFSAGKLGSGKMNSTLARGLKETLGDTSSEWSMVKQAAFRQLWQKPKDGMQYGPQALSERILTFLNGPGTRELSQTIYNPQEIALMRRYAGALKRMVPPPGAVNYSGTAYEGARMARQLFNGLLTTLGGGAAGAPGAVAGMGAGEVIERGSNWLAGRGLLSPAGPRGVTRAGEAIGAGVVGGEVGGAASQWFDESRGLPRVNVPANPMSEENLRRFGG